MSSHKSANTSYKPSNATRVIVRRATDSSKSGSGWVEKSANRPTKKSASTDLRESA